MYETLHNWFVIQGVNEGVPYFWSSPVGATAVLVILVTSLYDIFKTKPDFVLAAYNWALVGVCSIAMLHVAENSNPRHQMMVIVLALAIKKLWCVYLHYKGSRK